MHQGEIFDMVFIYPFTIFDKGVVDQAFKEYLELNQIDYGLKGSISSGRFKGERFILQYYLNDDDHEVVFERSGGTTKMTTIDRDYNYAAYVLGIYNSRLIDPINAEIALKDMKEEFKTFVGKSKCAFCFAGYGVYNLLENCEKWKKCFDKIANDVPLIITSERFSEEYLFGNEKYQRDDDIYYKIDPSSQIL